MARAAKASLFLTALAIGVGGCSLLGLGPKEQAAPAAAAPAPLTVVISAAERLNPDEQGQSLPTVVRLYQLKSSARLQNAEADQVYRNPKEVLGEDLLGVEEITLSPGETVKREVERVGAARVIAAVAMFRRPTATSWRALAEWPAAAQSGARFFALDGYRVELR